MGSNPAGVTSNSRGRLIRKLLIAAAGTAALLMVGACASGTGLSAGLTTRMDRPGANPLRVGGIAVSWLVLLGLGLWAILIAYQSPPISTGVTLPTGRSAAVGTP